MLSVDTLSSRGVWDTGDSNSTSKIVGSVAAGMVVFVFFHAVIGSFSFSSDGEAGGGALSVCTGLRVSSMVAVEGEGASGPLITTAEGRGFLGMPGERSPVSSPGSIPLVQSNPQS